MTALGDLVGVELDQPVDPAIAAMGRAIGDRLGGIAVLFYGSILRTGDMSGVLDFYVLTDGVAGSALRRIGTRWLWPDVSFHEILVEGRPLRAKVATMPLATFEEAAAGKTIDTTIWTRFVQPAALIHVANTAIRARVTAAVGAAAVSAARFAAVLGPASGTASDYWQALFRQTYRAELRVEKPGRERQIIAFDPARYDALLPAAWAAGDVSFKTDDRDDALLTPALPAAERRDIERLWRRRRRAGRPLNIARLVKAAFTFEGAARYGAWKIERHTGVSVPLTPWRERHPVLAAPAVLWQVYRAR